MPTKKSRSALRLTAYAWMLVNTLVWGAAFIAVKPALEVTSPVRYLFYRYVISVIISLPILWWYRKELPKPKTKKVFLPLVGIELLGTTLALWLIYAGLRLTTAIEANLLTTAMPVFVTLGGIFFLREREERHEALGLALALLGTILLVFVPVLQNGGNLVFTSLFGNILLLIAMLVDASYYLLAKRYYKGHPKFLISTLSFYVGLVTFGILALYESQFSAWQLWTTMLSDLAQPSVWIASGYMAIFGSLIGLTAYYQGQEHIEASEASLFTYLQPLVAVPLGILLLGEHFYSLQALAFLLIVVGVYVAEKRVRKK